MSCPAGLYGIDIVDHKSQDRLSDGPIALVVTAAAPVAWQSAAKFGKSLSQEGILVAGAPLEVTVDVKDKHGNLWPGKLQGCTSMLELTSHSGISEQRLIVGLGGRALHDWVA